MPHSSEVRQSRPASFGRDGRRVCYADPRRPLSAMPYVLYQRDDCHLCDLALAVLAEAGMPAFESVFIDDDERLEARYGHRVPMLQCGNGVELDWPFEAAAVAAAVRGASGETE